MKKILHIAKPIAGVGVYISLVCKYIDEDFENLIICNKEDSTIKLVNSKEEKIKSFHVPIVRKINLYKDFKCLKAILKIIRNVNPDIIHCHSAKAGILGRIAGFITKTKTFYTPHAYSYLSTQSNIKKNIFKVLEKIVGFLPSYTLACSKSEYERAVKDLKIDKKKVLSWDNSIEDIGNLNVETDDFNYTEYICSVGRPSYQKNTELLVKSILQIKNKIPNIHLLILGIGFYSPSLQSIEEFIEENDLSQNITLIPWLEREKSLSILKKSLFYISTSRYEGLSYAAIEAMSLGKLCILSNVDGNRDLIKNGYNGFLVEENISSVSKKIIETIESKELLKRMSINARKEYEQFYNIEKNILLLEKLYLL